MGKKCLRGLFSNPSDNLSTEIIADFLLKKARQAYGYVDWSKEYEIRRLAEELYTEIEKVLSSTEETEK